MIYLTWISLQKIKCYTHVFSKEKEYSLIVMLKPEVQLLRARVLSNFRQIGPRFRRLDTACKAADPRACPRAGPRNG